MTSTAIARSITASPESPQGSRAAVGGRARAPPHLTSALGSAGGCTCRRRARRAVLRARPRVWRSSGCARCRPPSQSRGGRSPMPPAGPAAPARRWRMLAGCCPGWAGVRPPRLHAITADTSAWVCPLRHARHCLTHPGYRRALTHKQQPATCNFRQWRLTKAGAQRTHARWTFTQARMQGKTQRSRNFCVRGGPGGPRSWRPARRGWRAPRAPRPRRRTRPGARRQRSRRAAARARAALRATRTAAACARRAPARCGAAARRRCALPWHGRSAQRRMTVTLLYARRVSLQDAALGPALLLAMAVPLRRIINTNVMENTVCACLVPCRGRQTTWQINCIAQAAQVRTARLFSLEAGRATSSASQGQKRAATRSTCNCLALTQSAQAACNVSAVHGTGEVPHKRQRCLSSSSCTAIRALQGSSAVASSSCRGPQAPLATCAVSPCFYTTSIEVPRASGGSRLCGCSTYNNNQRSAPSVAREPNSALPPGAST
jgi:hypothetical protein